MLNAPYIGNHMNQMIKTDIREILPGWDLTGLATLMGVEDLSGTLDEDEGDSQIKGKSKTRKSNFIKKSFRKLTIRIPPGSGLSDCKGSGLCRNLWLKNVSKFIRSREFLFNSPISSSLNSGLVPEGILKKKSWKPSLGRKRLSLT